MVTGLSANFCQLSMRLRDLPSTFHAAADITSTFLHPHTLPSTSINIPCIHGTFRELFMQLQTLRRLSCTRTPFRRLPSTFRASAVPSVNFLYGSGAFRQITVWPRTFCQLSLHQHNFPSTYVIFPCIRWTFSKLTSTFRASEKFSVNFP